MKISMTCNLCYTRKIILLVISHEKNLWKYMLKILNAVDAQAQ
jgi:hypothetical protein